MQILNFIRYIDGSKTKSLHLIQEIAPYWRALAGVLGFNPAGIKIIGRRHPQEPVDAVHDVLTQWMGKDPDCCWAKLISALVEADDSLGNVARDFKFALTHQLK